MAKLGDLLQQVSVQAEGSLLDADIAGVCALSPGQPGALAWCGESRWLEAARGSQAAAILVPASLQGELPQGVVVDKPQAVFAEIARLFAPDERPAEGVHPSASIDPTAVLGPGVRIGAQVSVGPGAQIGDASSIGAGSVIGAGVQIGQQADIGPRVVIAARSQIGDRVLILPGAVIGSRGFGNYHDGQRWRDIPQLGRVRIGHDVEIGANTSIDCGALDDTVIGDNVRIDNLCQIAHNVQIGPQTAIAAQVGIAGSTRIGAGCMLGGQVGVNGHIDICDRVIVSGGSNVLQSVSEPGVYGSGSPLLPVGSFRRLMALLRRLEGRLKSLEKGQRGVS